jgi:hypothetical protein
MRQAILFEPVQATSGFKAKYQDMSSAQAPGLAKLRTRQIGWVKAGRSRGEPAAINRHDRPGRERRGVARQMQRGLRDLLRFAKSLHGMAVS